MFVELNSAAKSYSMYSTASRAGAELNQPQEMLVLDSAVATYSIPTVVEYIAGLLSLV
jgi:hypothetical protein